MTEPQTTMRIVGSKPHPEMGCMTGGEFVQFVLLNGEWIPSDEVLPKATLRYAAGPLAVAPAERARVAAASFGLEVLEVRNEGILLGKVLAVAVRGPALGVARMQCWVKDQE